MREGERGQGCALVWRRLAAVRVVRYSCHRFTRHRSRSSRFAGTQCAGPKNKKPGALARSGFSL